MTIGVTGGIGSGKSTVCGFFGTLGAVVIDADKVAHEALDTQAAQAKIADRFGADVVVDGRIDRRELGKRAFVDEDSRRVLTDVVWPEVGRLMGGRVQDCLATDSNRPVVIEVPLLLEWGDPDGLCEKIVVVTAPEAIRVERTVERLSITPEEVQDRARHQMPEDEKVQHADYVIQNDADLATLERRSRATWEQLLNEGKP